MKQAGAKFRKLLLARLREPSTWAGLALVVQAGAQAVATQDPQAIGATAAAVAAMLLPERRDRASGADHG